MSGVKGRRIFRRLLGHQGRVGGSRRVRQPRPRRKELGAEEGRGPPSPLFLHLLVGRFAAPGASTPRSLAESQRGAVWPQLGPPTRSQSPRKAGVPKAKQARCPGGRPVAGCSRDRSWEARRPIRAAHLGSPALRSSLCGRPIPAGALQSAGGAGATLGCRRRGESMGRALRAAGKRWTIPGSFVGGGSR